MGVPEWLTRLPLGLNPGNMMLMSEGDGEGARDETALDILEALTSQFWSSSSNSSLVGPPSVLSTEQNKGRFHILNYVVLAKEHLAWNSHYV